MKYREQKVLLYEEEAKKIVHGRAFICSTWRERFFIWKRLNWYFPLARAVLMFIHKRNLLYNKRSFYQLGV